MITVINAPAWAEQPLSPGTIPGALRQLINVTGPLASGMAAALEVVQASELAEQAGHKPVMSAEKRSQVVGLCLVATQLLAEAASDACEALTTKR
jgi:hypothetical protein